MVEQATHNRQVTGSSPVGAKYFKECAVLFRNPVLSFYLLSWTFLSCLGAGGALPYANAQELRPPLEVEGTPAPSVRSAPPGGQGVAPGAAPPAISPAVSPAPAVTDTAAPNPAAPATNPAPIDGLGGRLPLTQTDFPGNIPNPANVKGLVGTIKSVSDDFLPGKPCKDCVAVKIEVANGTTRATIADGNKARGYWGEQALTTWSEARVVEPAQAQFSKGQKQLLGAVAVGTFWLAEPILQDHFTTSKTDPLVKLGKQQTRRNIEQIRFGQRLLLPYEICSGYMYFSGAVKIPDKIIVPLLYYPGGGDAGELVLLPDSPSNHNESL